jgi:hypothetical protein
MWVKLFLQAAECHDPDFQDPFDVFALINFSVFVKCATNAALAMQHF